MEISLASGFFNMYNRLQEAFHTDLDAEEFLAQIQTPPSTTRERIRTYVQEVLAED